MSQNALVVLANGFEEIEAVTPIDILRRADIKVTVAGVNELQITGSRGITILADARLADITGDFDACILPGGMPGASNLANSEMVKAILQAMHQENKLIAAICAAPAVVLSPLGLLKKKRATCSPGMQKNFAEDILYSDERVVLDGNILTSQGAGTAFSFALAIVEYLVGKDIRNKIAKATVGL